MFYSTTKLTDVKLGRQKEVKAPETQSEPTTTQQAATTAGGCWGNPTVAGCGDLHRSLGGASLPEPAAQENADGEAEDQETHGHCSHRRPQLAAASLVPGGVL